MNFRRQADPQVYGFQIAPMVDILLVLLVFFIVTWNFSLNEKELDVKIPPATNAQDHESLRRAGGGECEDRRLTCFQS